MQHCGRQAEVGCCPGPTGAYFAAFELATECCINSPCRHRFMCWHGSCVQDKMQEYKGQGIVLQGDTNNNNLFKVCSGPSRTSKL